MTNETTFDLAVGSIILLSILFYSIKGGFGTLISWFYVIIAIYASSSLHTRMYSFFSAWITYKPLLTITSYIITFIPIYIILKAVSNLIERNINQSSFRLLNSVLGGVYGAIFSLLLIVIALSLCQNYLDVFSKEFVISTYSGVIVQPMIDKVSAIGTTMVENITASFNENLKPAL